MTEEIGKDTAINVAEAKRRFSDLLGRVAYGRETILITRRGRPMARLVPIEKKPRNGNELSRLHGWLEDEDPFFDIVDEIVSDRRSHRPRILDPDAHTSEQ